MTKGKPEKNIARRTLGIALCATPILLALACVLWPRAPSPAREAAALVLTIGATLLGLWNLYLGYGRPWRYRRRHGSPTGYRLVSGLPLVGTLLLVAGCVTAFGSPLVGCCGLLAALVDPDGLPWIPVHTWKDGSLWDG